MFDSEKTVFVDRQDIIIKNKRIDAVGADLPVPAGVREYDLNKFSVVPGLIDSQTHLLYLEDIVRGSTMEGVKAVVTEGTPLRALHGAARGRTFLAVGITRVRDSGHFGDIALRDAINSFDHAYQGDDTTLALMHERGVVMLPTDVDGVTIVNLLNRDQNKKKPTIE